MLYHVLNLVLGIWDVDVGDWGLYLHAILLLTSLGKDPVALRTVHPCSFEPESLMHLFTSLIELLYRQFLPCSDHLLWITFSF